MEKDSRDDRALTLFGIEQALGHGTSGATLALGYGGLLTGELAARIAKSPALRKYYLNVIKAAKKDNAAMGVSNLRKLQSQLDKEND